MDDRVGNPCLVATCVDDDDDDDDEDEDDDDDDDDDFDNVVIGTLLAFLMHVLLNL